VFDIPRLRQCQDDENSLRYADAPIKNEWRQQRFTAVNCDYLFRNGSHLKTAKFANSVLLATPQSGHCCVSNALLRRNKVAWEMLKK